MIRTACRYAPEELMAGFDTDCERLDPHPEGFACSESCAHANLCSYVKAVIEEVSAEGIEEVLLTSCCDANKRLYDVLAGMDSVKFVYLLDLPHKNGEAEVKRFAGELRKFVQAYAEYSHKTFDEAKAKAAWAKSSSEKYRMPEGRYIRLAGAHGGSLLLREMQKAFGDIEILDETCTGNRKLNLVQGEDFFDAYAKALLNQENPCLRMWFTAPVRHSYVNKPLGTVYHTIKFCDYYGFGYREEEGRVLKIETDTTPQSSGQIRTRLEAFREELGMSIETKIHHEGPVYTAGVDSGSTSTDAVILNGEKKIVGSAIVPTGAGVKNGARMALQQALAQAGIREEDLAATVSTGYGRSSIGLDGKAVTEITCHAIGAHFLDPDVRTVIDIGGQDSKVIRVDENGHVENFVMNDKCAAGTGRFLEMQARALNMDLEEMVEKGLHWRKKVEISSMCTVFAESEVVSLVAEDTPAEDIIHGLNEAVAAKTAGLVRRAGGKEKYMLTGGVARNEGVRKCLEEKLGAYVEVKPEAQLCGALGAALLAWESVDQCRQSGKRWQS